MQDPADFRFLNRLSSRLGKPVDLAALALFRAFLGGLCLYGTLLFYFSGTVEALWLVPEFRFKYFGFEWVGAFPDLILRGLWLGLCIAFAGIMLGAFYRFCAIYAFVVVAYFFLLDQAPFLNQYYLLLWVLFWMAMIPAHGMFSLDAMFRASVRRAFVPSWMVVMLCFSMACVYFFGGVAKINADWLHGEPMTSWLTGKVGESFFTTGLATGDVAWFFSYAGLIFDLLVVPLLIWRRTRIFGFILSLVFHVGNSVLFSLGPGGLGTVSLGFFPWISIALTGLFFPTDWPRKIFRKWAGSRNDEGAASTSIGNAPVVLLVIAVGLQLLLPLRPFFYPGNASWTDDGHRFAWRMKLRWKTGTTRYFVRENRQEELEKVYPDAFITDYQESMLLGRPDMILQLAHHIGKERMSGGATAVEVYARSKIALNGRTPQDFIDRRVDLMTVKRSLGPTTWLLPLKEEQR
ncbi:MAG: HTTM domain-containing protein [Verrucomicrobiota bacterium]